MKNNYTLRKRILLHLQRRGYWGGRHTSAENALKGIAGHLIGKAKSALNDLIKEHLILSKPTHYGLQIYLNPGKKKEIEALLKDEI